jgi:hypothetical protein
MFKERPVIRSFFYAPFVVGGGGEARTVPLPVRSVRPGGDGMRLRRDGAVSLDALNHRTSIMPETPARRRRHIGFLSIVAS